MQTYNHVKIQSSKEQLYIKVLQSNVCVQSILEEAVRQLQVCQGREEIRELCLLDTKFNKICDTIPKGTSSLFIIIIYNYT